MTKKIFKSIGLIALAIAVAIGSFFVPISKKGTSHIASADNTSSSITFNGSNIWLPVARTTRENTELLDYLLLNINFKIDRLNGNLNYNFNGTTGFYTTGEFYTGGYEVNYRLIRSLPAYNNGVLDLGLVFNRELTNEYNTTYVSDSHDTGYLSYTIVGSKYIIDSDIVSVTLGFTNSVNTNNDYYANFIRYNDKNGNFITFYFRTFIGASTTNQLEPRTYYFSNSFDLSDNEFFQQGYNEGLLDNQSNIYDNGYNTGFDDGFEDGKITGAVEANDYSFFSLFGAIFDAPVTLFTSLLNFEFLGINLWSFITSLLTLAIILFVIKLFIRR